MCGTRKYLYCIQFSDGNGYYKAGYKFPVLCKENATKFEDLHTAVNCKK